MIKNIKLPDVFIIGAQKSGTTTLFNWIAQHPQVFANPAAKDFPFFCNNDVYSRGVDCFARLFVRAPNDSLVLGGEANLLYVSQAVERLHHHLPDARLIAILRNPTNRYFSAWHYAVERQLENRTLELAFNEEMKGLQCLDQWESLQKNYLEHGNYSKQILRVLEFYPKKNLKIILFEDLIKNPVETLQDIFSFLKIAPLPQIKFEHKNKTKGKARFGLLSKILYSQRSPNHPFWNISRKVFPTKLRLTVREQLVKFNRVSAPPPFFPHHIKMSLQDYYANDVKSLEKLLERNLEEWRN